MMYLDYGVLMFDEMTDDMCAETKANPKTFLSGQRVKILKRKRDRALVQADDGQRLYWGWVYLDYLNRHNKG